MKRFTWIVLLMSVAAIVLFTSCTSPAPAPSPSASPAASSAAPSAKPAAAADSAEEFFKKNTVTLIAPFAAGAGSDFGGRLMASYWPDVSGGGAMIVKNMDGGGGLVGANFGAAAKPDGLTLTFGNTTSSAIIPAVFKDPAIKYDPLKQTWIGSLFDDPTLAVIRKDLPYNTLDEIKKAKGLKFGAVGPRGVATIAAAVVIDALGLDVKIITGYKGGSDLEFALAKKEIDGFATNIMTITNAVNQGNAKTPFLLLQRERIKSYPNTPTIYEVAKWTPEQEKLYQAGIDLSRSFRALYGPPGIPEDRVKFLRKAFLDITKMPSFKTQAGTLFPVWTEPVNGEDLTRSVAQMMTTDGNKMKEMVDKYLAVK